ncbi:methyltransferase, FxLD system [Amycolatopsis vastitatis]|uniref:Protein-L-isoaspartate O-methyltransferase n=1 Tax=Amycolatopsis vastitatis TaxID=1905142 RepID=A0A229SLP0_9PSEU|nr:methyltransferase, FxLD system [Amycolatopsis vastitatis]OXM59664.1 methyltransferase, FxLD system [Amycolatopsis vastitatis]
MTTARDVDTNAAPRADELRTAMVAALREMGAIQTEPVADVFRTVERHLFAPDAPLEMVYAANSAVVTKRDEAGLAISSLSAAHIQAVMLEQAQIRPGMRVLEVGSGGCNAAYLTKLVGPAGQVTSVDIDPDIVASAKAHLAAAGYDQVNVVLADAENGVPDHAPYDRVIVTAGAWDLPPAWSDQLNGGGQIVVPFRVRGLTRTVAFERDGDHLTSRDYRLCGFVPMQGIGAHTERRVPLDGDEVVLRVDEDKALDVDSLAAALRSPRLELWSGVEFDQVDELDFWIGTHAPVFGLLTAQDGPIECGLVAPSAKRGVPTLVRGGSFAYRTKRPIDGTDTFETGVYAHGPDARAVAEEYVELLRRWDRDHRGRRGAVIEAYPAGTPSTALPQGCVVDKKHTRVVISWPRTQAS